MDDLQKFYDRVFGNNDGKFNVKDLPNKAVLVVAIVVDLVALIAEARVYQVGLTLTNSPILAFGFVAVSFVPFLLGQIAFLYNRANTYQQIISALMVILGLFASAYYGFADYILQTNSVLTVAGGVILPIDINTLYFLAVFATVLLILGGLLFVFFDDEIATNRRKNKVQAKSKAALDDIKAKREVLAELKRLKDEETELRKQYGDDYDEVQRQFAGLVKTRNPTNGKSLQ